MIATADAVRGRAPLGALAAALAVSVAGFAAHNAVELGANGILRFENGFLGFVGAQIVFLVLARWRPRDGAGGLFATAIVQILGGAILSILPLAFLPYDPPQTVPHYAMHAVLGLAQLPLAVVAWRALRAARRP